MTVSRPRPVTNTSFASGRAPENSSRSRRRASWVPASRVPSRSVARTRREGSSWRGQWRDSITVMLHPLQRCVRPDSRRLGGGPGLGLRCSPGRRVGRRKANPADRRSFVYECAIDTGKRQAEEGRRRRHGCRRITCARCARRRPSLEIHLYNSISWRHRQPAISQRSIPAVAVGTAVNASAHENSYCKTLSRALIIRLPGRLVQLVRILGRHPRGRRFESCTAHQTSRSQAPSNGCSL